MHKLSLIFYFCWALDEYFVRYRELFIKNFSGFLLESM